MGALNLFTKSLYFTRCHLISDSAAKSSLQVLFENALGKTRQFLRIFTRRKDNISNNYRSQHRLPEEFFNKAESTVPRKSKFLSYRPGLIHEVTSKWVSESLAGSVGKQATKKFLQGARGPMLCFVGFGLATKPSLLTDEEELESVSFEIREAFSTVPFQNCGEKLSILEAFQNKQLKFSDLKIGDMIAKGCNAAVYSAALAEEKKPTDDLANNEVSLLKPEAEVTHSKLFISHSEGEQGFVKKPVNEPATTLTIQQQKHKEDFNLAVKVMFNYSAESNAYAIWRAMYKETLPSIAEFSFGEMNWHKHRKKKLKPHPNIVEMYSAFADQLPLLPGAFTSFPQALPVRLLSDGCGRNMTLFLVMKKYDCSLKEYLKTHEVSTHTALLLFTQLLEGLVHLLQNEIAHRDLKTDNILLDLSYGTNSPRLAITDFGCSLEGLQLNYSSPEIEKGGNIALMAPEVVTAEAGSFSVIDYSRADLWTAGTLAYEIFGGSNPFYSSNSNLKNLSYDEKLLPPLPTKAPSVVQKLVRDILRVQPNQRPSPQFAATVCQILVHQQLNGSKCSSAKDVRKNVLEWMCMLSAETYIETCLRNPVENTVELELRHTFCSRIQYLDVLEAMKYISLD